MSRLDVIVALYFLSDNAGKILSRYNQDYFVPAVEAVYDLEELPPGETPPPVPPPPARLPSLDFDWLNGHRLELRWDSERKDETGFYIGTEETCDICIPRIWHFSGVSARQGRISFDAQYRLTYRDMRKRDSLRYGSAVSYNGQGGEKRLCYTWLLSGTEYLDRLGKEAPEIILQLHDELRFGVCVPPRTCTDAEHAAMVKTYGPYAGSDGDSTPSVGPFRWMTLGSRAQTTALPSGAETLGTEPIFVEDKEIGRGSYGRVVRLYGVSDGTYIAQKSPVKGILKPGSWNETVWKREVHSLTIIKQASDLHPERSRHVVQMIEYCHGIPAINLEYVPCGNLYEQHYDMDRPLSDKETRVVLEQILMALAFIHEIDITHRDVKPRNILVQHRAPLDAAATRNGDELIHIKLTDFGLSKWGNLETSELGTSVYRAPELFYHSDYTTAVDIWSTGVMVYELVHGLPDIGNSYRRKMCELVEKAIQDRMLDSDLASFVSDWMVKWLPEQRLSASACLDRVRRKLLGARPVNASAGPDGGSGAATPRAVSPTSGDSQNTIQSGNVHAPPLPNVDSWEEPGGFISLPDDMTGHLLSPRSRDHHNNQVSPPPDDFSAWAQPEPRPPRSGNRSHASNRRLSGIARVSSGEYRNLGDAQPRHFSGVDADLVFNSNTDVPRSGQRAGSFSKKKIVHSPKQAVQSPKAKASRPSTPGISPRQKTARRSAQPPSRATAKRLRDHDDDDEQLLPTVWSAKKRRSAAASPSRYPADADDSPSPTNPSARYG